MGWLPEIELDGFTGLLVILALVAFVWAVIYTSGALLTLGVWAVIVILALIIIYYAVVRVDKLLRGGYR